MKRKVYLSLSDITSTDDVSRPFELTVVQSSSVAIHAAPPIRQVKERKHAQPKPQRIERPTPALMLALSMVVAEDNNGSQT